VGSGAKPQPTNDLVHIWAKRSSSGGNSFMDFHGNKFNFLVHLQLKICLNLQNSVVPTPIMALPDQKLVVPRHYRHIGLRRPCLITRSDTLTIIPPYHEQYSWNTDRLIHILCSVHCECSDAHHFGHSCHLFLTTEF